MTKPSAGVTASLQTLSDRREFMMPTSSPRDTDPERTLRDVLSLSTLPTVWLGAEPVRIVESLCAALFTLLEADFVYVSLHGDAEHSAITAVQTTGREPRPDVGATLAPALLDWARTHDPEDVMRLRNPWGPGTLHLCVRPLAVDAEYGLIAAGFLQDTSPDTRHQLLMNVAATHATTAIENVRLLRSLRRYAAQQHAAVKDAETARAEAEAASRTKDEFLAMLGHELRNPLAPIQTALQLMRLRGDGSAERERTVIERQVTHLTRLVDDLLDVSRIARGKVELKHERLDIADVVTKAIEMASPLIEHGRHRLDVHAPREGLTVDGDPLRLAQVISNLLTNAAKYTEPGGVISIRAERTDGEVAVRVRDTGIGISADMLPRIFDLFVQERQNVDRSQGGLGLGLTIVRSLVAMHRGSVSVHSDGPGRGSEFTIRLPVAVADDASVTEHAPSPGLTPTTTVPSNVRVLVVDDNEDAVDMLAEVFKSKGYHVRSAHDGPAAIRMCAEFNPHIALLDIGLPVMDGYELAERLRQLPGSDRLFLCALTGYAQEADRERARNAGFDRHFVKPLDFDALDRALAEIAETLRSPTDPSP